ncbi:hypothetical protein QCA50_009237 [Cerrena zonata]|uniref:Uncharacterized protein n=1 Tax=Cerrena zonata TaxID=2478898 RepID=A0AAW0GBT2_9APHY
MVHPVIQLIKLLFNPDVSKKIILQMAFQQIKVIGIARVLAAALGGVVVGASSVVKVPQILKVVNPPTLEGRIKVANGITLEGTRKALKPSDYVLLTGYSSGLILNLILAGQVVYYGKFYKASTDEDEAKKDI